MPLRVGIVNYLNSKPLAWSFLKGLHQDVLQAEYDSPAEVAERLAAGRLDVGLIPSIEVQRIPGLRLLPGLCVAATREVRSVLLVLGRPVEQIERVALDLNSRTSAALVRILLQDRYGRAPQCITAPPVLDRMLAEADAALLIGDPALRVDRQRYRVLDLAAEWRQLTGLPFVFAVWAVRKEVDLPGLEVYFEDSLATGLAELEELIGGASRELGLDAGELRRSLTENLSFRLGREELAGLEEFFRRAREHGLIAGLRPIEFWAPCSAAGDSVE